MPASKLRQPPAQAAPTGTASSAGYDQDVYTWTVEQAAALEATDETGLPRAAFPIACPCSLDDALDRPVEWPEP